MTMPATDVRGNKNVNIYEQGVRTKEASVREGGVVVGGRGRGAAKLGGPLVSTLQSQSTGIDSRNAGQDKGNGENNDQGEKAKTEIKGFKSANVVNGRSMSNGKGGIAAPASGVATLIENHVTKSEREHEIDGSESDAPVLRPNSTPEEVKQYYQNVIYVDEQKLKVVRQDISKIGGEEEKAIVSRLKKNYVFLLLFHPKVCDRYGWNIEQWLWINCFYKQLSLTRQKLEQYHAKLLSELKEEVGDAPTVAGVSWKRGKVITKYAPERKTFRAGTPENIVLEKRVKQLLSVYLNLLDKDNSFYESLAKKLDAKLNEISCKNVGRENGGFREENYVRNALHACYISLGDLARYRDKANKLVTAHGDIQDGTKAKQAISVNDEKSRKWYKCALSICPTNGNAYNQIATLELYRDRIILSGYYYVRAILVPEPFATAEANFKMLFKHKVKSNAKSLEEYSSRINEFIAKGGIKKAVLRQDVLDLFMGLEGTLLEKAHINVGRFIIALSNGFVWVLKANLFSKQIMLAFAVVAMYMVHMNTDNEVALSVALGILEAMIRFVNTGLARDKDNVPDRCLMVLAPVTVCIDWLLALVKEGSSKLLMNVLEHTSFMNILLAEFEAINKLADNAPISTMKARNSLQEEVKLKGLLPLSGQYKKFASYSTLSEKAAHCVRAVKYRNFCERLFETNKTVKIVASWPNSLLNLVRNEFIVPDKAEVSEAILMPPVSHDELNNGCRSHMSLSQTQSYTSSNVCSVPLSPGLASGINGASASRDSCYHPTALVDGTSLRKMSNVASTPVVNVDIPKPIIQNQSKTIRPVFYSPEEDADSDDEILLKPIGQRTFDSALISEKSLAESKLLTPQHSNGLNLSDLPKAESNMETKNLGLNDDLFDYPSQEDLGLPFVLETESSKRLINDLDRLLASDHTTYQQNSHPSSRIKPSKFEYSEGFLTGYSTANERITYDETGGQQRFPSERIWAENRGVNERGGLNGTMPPIDNLDPLKGLEIGYNPNDMYQRRKISHASNIAPPPGFDFR